MKFEVIQNEYSELLKNIQNYFKESQNSIHKARNEIKTVDFKGKSLVIKSFKVPHFINRVVYTLFRDTKAKKSYENSIKIAQFVPKPIGYIEFKKYGLLYDSYFVSENFEYDFTIREPLLQSDFFDKESIFKEFSNFTFKLHEEGIFHLDYSPGNILIKKENGRFTFKIVDTNRMEFKALNIDDRLKNFSKLWAKNEDLKIIVREYCKIMKCDEESSINIALKYSQDHKDRKNSKKRLRGESVVD